LRNNCTSYTVVYVTRGIRGAEWHRSSPVWTYKDAEEVAERVERQGYVCMIHETQLLDIIGMPEDITEAELRKEHKLHHII
jgi:hypothetical protein